MVENSKTAYIFPGQGSQFAGMGRDLCDNFPTAKVIFQQADDALGFAFSKLCFEGPEEELRLTINAQPALVVDAYACLKVAQEVLGNKLPPAAFTAGHSLGEYTALAAAGVLDFATTVKLARERGRLMYEAGLARPGAMLAVMGMDEPALSEVCTATGTCIANFNCPGQLVISGSVENIGKAGEVLKSKGSRAIPLAVSGAFHSPLMQPTVEGMIKAIAGIQFKDPIIPVIANTTATPLTAAAQVKTELTEQLCHGVQWQRSVEYMINAGVTIFIEIGPGKVLSGLVRRINKTVTTVNLSDVASIKAFQR